MKWYKVKGVPKELSLIGLKRGEIYLSIESVNLTVLDVFKMVEEVGGDILVGVDNGLSGVMVSESAIGGGLILQGSENFEAYVQTIRDIKRKLKVTEVTDLSDKIANGER